MKHNYYAFFIFYALLLTGCKTAVKESILTDLPEAVSNNAVSEANLKGNQYLYTFGGIDSSKSYSGIHQRSYRLNTTTGDWQQLDNLPDSLGKIAMSANRIGDVIYIMGGYHVFEDGSEKSSDKVHRFSVKENKFLSDGLAIPTAIDDHVQFTYKDRYIFLITGWSDSTNVSLTQIYDSKENKWLEGTSPPEDEDYQSFGASGAVIGNTIYYYGGANSNREKKFSGQSVLRKGIIEDEDFTISWSKQNENVLPVMYRSAAVTRNKHILFLGGSNETYNYDGIAYADDSPVPPSKVKMSLDTATGDISIFAAELPMDLRNVVQLGNDVIFVGGMENNQVVSKNVVLHRLSND